MEAKFRNIPEALWKQLAPLIPARRKKTLRGRPLSSLRTDQIRPARDRGFPPVVGGALSFAPRLRERGPTSCTPTRPRTFLAPRGRREVRGARGIEQRFAVTWPPLLFPGGLGAGELPRVRRSPPGAGGGSTWTRREHPTRTLQAHESGYHLCPNDAKPQAMANAVDLKLFPGS
jgi:hypothetical protein